MWMCNVLEKDLDSYLFKKNAQDLNSIWDANTFEGFLNKQANFSFYALHFLQILPSILSRPNNTIIIHSIYLNDSKAVLMQG